MRYYGNDGFTFAWDLGIIFLAIPNLVIGWFLGKCFWSSRCHGKLCRLFPYIPIFFYFFFGGGLFLAGYAWYLKKTHWYLSNVLWWLKRVYAKRGRQSAVILTTARIKYMQYIQRAKSENGANHACNKPQSTVLVLSKTVRWNEKLSIVFYGWFTL